MLKKTIVGNLGNQMFQYAALRGIQARLYPHQEICLSFTTLNSHTGIRDTKENYLRHYALKPYLTEDIIRPAGMQRLISGSVGVLLERSFRNRDVAGCHQIQHRTELCMQPVLNRFGIYQMQDGYYPFHKAWTRDQYVTGYLESERYFEEIADEIRAEFQPIDPLLPNNKALMNHIQSSNSVCISIRRGDFVGTEIDQYANICDAAYYTRAMDRMRALFPDAEWFFFSDDIEWVKANVPYTGTAFYESGADPVWEKLRLMSACRHFIIANSSFAWWAQFLGSAEDKRVIAPSQWRRNSPRPDIYQSDWIRIDV